MLKIQCPKCEKGEKSELLEVLPDRRYRLRCTDCEFTYTMTGDLNRDKDTCTESETKMARKKRRNKVTLCGKTNVLTKCLRA